MKKFCLHCKTPVEQRDWQRHQSRHREARRPPRQRWKRGRKWMALRQKWIDIVGERCMGCGITGVPLELDHRPPRTQGGPDAFENTWLLCRPCHARKHRA